MEDSGSVKGVILTADRDAGGSVAWDRGTGLLFPLANTPMVERILDGYRRAGVRETLIAAGRHTGEIAALCGDGARWDMRLAYLACKGVPDGQSLVEQGEQGLIERVRELAAFTQNAPFLVTAGPVLLESEVYRSLVHTYCESRACGIRAGWRAGRTEGDADRADGIYVMTPRVYDLMMPRLLDSMAPQACDSLALQDSGAPDNVDSRDGTPASLFGQALDELAARGETVLDRDPDHPPFSVGSPEAYLDSNERLLASVGASDGEEIALPEIMDDNFSSPNLVLRPPAIVDATAELERCRIGPGVCIGPGVRIGHGAAIEHSVVMKGADIGDGASISHAVIGRNASIENRAVIHGRADRVRVVRSR